MLFVERNRRINSNIQQYTELANGCARKLSCFEGLEKRFQLHPRAPANFPTSPLGSRANRADGSDTREIPRVLRDTESLTTSVKVIIHTLRPSDENRLQQCPFRMLQSLSCTPKRDRDSICRSTLGDSGVSTRSRKLECR